MKPIAVMNNADLWYSPDNEETKGRGYYWQCRISDKVSQSYCTRNGAIRSMDMKKVKFRTIRNMPEQTS